MNKNKTSGWLNLKQTNYGAKIGPPGTYVKVEILLLGTLIKVFCILCKFQISTFLEFVKVLFGISNIMWKKNYFCISITWNGIFWSQSENLFYNKLFYFSEKMIDFIHAKN